jgi:hypothetical protein
MRTVAIAALLTTIFAAPSVTAFAQSGPSTNGPSLSETLQWLSGATDAESANGNDHYTFETNANESCFVTITETRVQAGPDFWIKLSFSLGDIDPDDIQVQVDAGLPGDAGVRFHTTNYVKKIISAGHWKPEHESPVTSHESPVSEHILLTNDSFAPKFAKAFAHAARLCGAKKSSF